MSKDTSDGILHNRDIQEQSEEEDWNEQKN